MISLLPSLLEEWQQGIGTIMPVRMMRMSQLIHPKSKNIMTNRNTNTEISPRNQEKRAHTTEDTRWRIGHARIVFLKTIQPTPDAPTVRCHQSETRVHADMPDLNLQTTMSTIRK